MEGQSKVGNVKSVFEKKITLGNIIQLGVLLVALILAYSRLQSNQEMLQLHIEAQKQITEQLKQDLNQQYVRTDIHNEQLRNINTKLQDIQDDLKDIKHTLKR